MFSGKAVATPLPSLTARIDRDYSLPELFLDAARAIMYKPLRVALKSLWREFRRASFLYPSLRHELIFAWEPHSLPRKTWEAFVDDALKRTNKPSWERFEIFPNLECCGRFFGNEAGLEEAKRLGESLFLVLCELDPELDRNEGYFGFLSVLDDMAFKYPTPLLRAEASVWGAVFVPAENVSGDKNESDYCDWFEEQVSRWSTPEHGKEAYPTNPCCRSLVQNVFTSAMGAIQNILNPDATLLVGDKIDELPFASLIERRVTRRVETAPETAVEEVNKVQSVLEPEKLERTDTPTFEYRLIGDVRFIRYHNEVGHFADMEGFRHIAKMFARPEHSFPALELQGLQDSPVANLNLTPQFALDRKTKQVLENQIADLDQEIAQAEQTGDPAHVLELKEEHHKITEYLKEAHGRRLGDPSAREKARKAVSMAIHRAKQKLQRKMPEFVKFLNRSILANDASFTYCPPSPAPEWVL
jgi:hypothetical protein